MYVTCIYGVLQFPDALAKQCKHISAGEDGWVLDPFTQDLLPEYYDCSQAPGIVWGWSIPFTATAARGPGLENVTSAFHYDKPW